ncbi:hypothetical protein BSR29_03885 [Boudabousia liubingyangii]|uniref:VanZ-like domain-containing protein n=1 Tax=Boudabousia liubingyangii TaxID=1921764 RepID=A0A1Q5PN80_9ACTO|nr:VanZ family protein [Boudabousia liubingyangii]OKL47563.1 hypothetical protein BSR28_03455 [Boudabousia liubingyangii]OKL48987.1 hypothetical protein BSR29_03885 [Boudabousia liubingyangii]
MILIAITGSQLFAHAVLLILVGMLLSAVVFIPLSAFRYFLMGSKDNQSLKFGFHSIVMIYVTALIGYTFFPIPKITPYWCSRRPAHRVVLDPTLPFRSIRQQVMQGENWLQILFSHSATGLWLNVLLFVPMGFILVWHYRLSIRAALALGFISSLFIEVAQFSANFGLVECQYRISDINDLLMNTLGAFLGAFLAQSIRALVKGGDGR